MSDYDPVAFWNDNAERRRGGNLHFSGPGANNVRAWIDEYGKPEHTFLDVGPGNGRVYDRLDFTMDRFFMVELAPEMARMCQERIGAPVALWDGETLPWLDDTFDWVLSISVMQHVRPERIERFVKEHARVSKRYVLVATCATMKNEEAHNFGHDYLPLFKGAELRIVKEEEIKGRKSVQWLLQKRGNK